MNLLPSFWQHINKRHRKRAGDGVLHIRKCPLWHFRKFVKTVGYDEFVGITKYTGGETTMKSLFEQFGGTYRKENDYVIPNFEMLDIANFEFGIYGQLHLRYL